jgi:hypothetical protein
MTIYPMLQLLQVTCNGTPDQNKQFFGFTIIAGYAVMHVQTLVVQNKQTDVVVCGQFHRELHEQYLNYGVVAAVAQVQFVATIVHLLFTVKAATMLWQVLQLHQDVNIQFVQEVLGLAHSRILA